MVARDSTGAGTETVDWRASVWYQEAKTPEERLAKIEGILEQMSKTVADRGTQEQQGQRLTLPETDLRAVREKMHSQFRWTIGMIVASMLNMWIAMAVALPFR